MPYRRSIFSLKDISFHGDISFEDASFYSDILFEMVMIQFGLLIKIKSWSNDNERRGIMKDETQMERHQYI